jgi:hypothetical protein
LFLGETGSRETAFFEKLLELGDLELAVVHDGRRRLFCEFCE